MNAFVNESRKMMDAYDKRFNNLETHYWNMEETIKTLEIQIGQLAIAIQEQSSRTFSSDTEKKPWECTVITLKSGKELEDNKKEHKVKEGELEKLGGDITQATEPVKLTPGNITYPNKPPKIAHPPIPLAVQNEDD